MDEKTNKNESNSIKWLAVVSLGSGVAGWIVQGVLSEGFVYWALPLIWIGTAFFTMNGDNITESIVVLVILGLCAFVISRSIQSLPSLALGQSPGCTLLWHCPRSHLPWQKKGSSVIKDSDKY